MWPTCPAGIVLAVIGLAVQAAALDDVVTFYASNFEGFTYNGQSTAVLNNVHPYYFWFNTTTDYTANSVKLMDGNGTTLSTTGETNTISLDLQLNQTIGDTNMWTFSIADPGKIFDEGADLHVLYLEVGWSSSSYTGKSYSRAFTYALDISEVTDVSEFESDAPYSSQTYSSGTTVSLIPQGSATATISGTDPVATTAAGVASVGVASSSTAATAASSTAHSTGISKGAIAGIVVGVVAGLAVIGALAWFCLRRRRDSGSGYKVPQREGSLEQYGAMAGMGAATGYANSGGRGGPESVGDVRMSAAEGLIREKEDRAVAATMGLTERDGDGIGSSPYTDDYNSAATTAVAVPAMAVPAEVLPTVDTAAATKTRSVAAAGTPEVGTPVLSGHMAALIEDGMTAEDVARLEAEELELDEAIQNANRARNGGTRP